MIKKSIKIRDFYNNFEKLKEISDVYVDTPENNKQKINESVMKGPVDMVRVKSKHFNIRVASTHRFMNENGKEVYAKYAKQIMTKNGLIEVEVVEDGRDYVYDIMIDDPHWYYGKYGIIHHNTGKTAFLCYLAGMYLQQGLKVLFISCEMGENQIRERIDANLLGLSTDKFYKIKEEQYIKRLKTIQEHTTGEVFIKSYPPLKSNVITYNNFMRELELKENFKPDVVLVDYIGIVASSTLPISAMQNSNLYMGQVSKELRAFAVEHDVALWSAHQLNREGMKEIEIEMTHSGGSIDITKDSDFIMSLSQPEEMEQRNQMLAKQLKNRYAKKSRIKRFVLGCDTDLMRFYQVESDHQNELIENRGKSESEQKTQNTKQETKKNIDVHDWNL